MSVCVLVFLYSACEYVCTCMFSASRCACLVNQLLFWLRIKTDDRKCEAKGQIIGPY